MSKHLLSNWKVIQKLYRLVGNNAVYFENHLINRFWVFIIIIFVLWYCLHQKSKIVGINNPIENQSLIEYHFQTVTVLFYNTFKIICSESLSFEDGAALPYFEILKYFRSDCSG